MVHPARRHRTHRPRVGVVSLGAATQRPDVALLCDQVQGWLGTAGPRVVICDVNAVARPDIGTVDALARMQLTARRNGGELRLRAPSRMLLQLLGLVGLRDVLPLHPGVFVEPRR